MISSMTIYTWIFQHLVQHFCSCLPKKTEKSGMNYFIFLLSTPTDVNAVAPHFLSFSLVVRLPSWLIQVKSTTNFGFESTPSSTSGTLLLHLILLSAESSSFLSFSSEVFPLAGKRAYTISILTKIYNKSHLTLNACLWPQSNFFHYTLTNLVYFCMFSLHTSGHVSPHCNTTQVSFFLVFDTFGHSLY